MAKHAAEMSKRRKAHEHAFEFVWAAGPTGVSVVQLTAVKEDLTDNILTSAFRDTLLADSQIFKHHAKRYYIANGKWQAEPNNSDKVYMITSDRRVAELVQHVTKMLKESGDSGDEPPADVIVTPLATGNKDYIEWVKKVTTPKEESDFYKENPEEALDHVKKISSKDAKSADDESAKDKDASAEEGAEQTEENNVQLEELL